MDGRRDQDGPIAIIGIACRFPGARDPAEFHDLTVAGLRLFRPVSGGGRARHAALLDDWKATSAWSGDLEPGRRDPVPIQKLAAETAALALIDAGLGDAARRRGRTGLVIASAAPDVCGLVSEQFGFSSQVRYPATAYLSSLHAVAAAASALQAGELDLAVAGGAELGVDLAWLDQQARAGTLGCDEMRVYAVDPAGLLPGEGCGIVVLARAADARAAGMPSYAEIAGWSTTPVLRPAPVRPALLPAYLRAGIDPADIHLVEGHGTGTAAGDLAELTTLAHLRHGGKSTAALGAVSANIGYSRAATGIASLIKAALAMTTGAIPPGTGCARPHPLIEAGDARLRLPERPEPWPDGTRLAAVNSLGTADPATMNGASAWPGAEGVHLVLRREREADRRPGRRRRAIEVPVVDSGRAGGSWPAAPGKHAAPSPTGTPARAPYSPEAGSEPAVTAAPPAVTADPPAVTAAPPAVTADPPAVTADPPAVTADPPSIMAPPGVFALCGGDPGALADRLEVIAASAQALSDAELRELARQLAFGVIRADGDRVAALRVALAPATAYQLALQARYAARRLRTEGRAAAVAEPGVRISAGATGTVVVVFPGLAESAAAHSALLAASLAGLRGLDLIGVRPCAAVGYSLGEITGLVWAGSLPAAEAARLVAQRGQILLGSTTGPAAMARVAADAQVARALCAPDRLHIAAYEGPRAQVLAGSTAGIRNVVRRAGAAGVAAEVLGVASAQHSPAMARCTAPLRSVLAGTQFAPPGRRLISTITGRPVSAGDDIAELLARQLSLPVLFAPALTAAAEGADLIVAAGPDDGLAARATACTGVPAISLPVTMHGALDADPAASAQTVAALFAAGAITDLAPFLGRPGPTCMPAAGTVPRMRDALAGPDPEPPVAPASRADRDRAVERDTGARTTARSGR